MEAKLKESSYVPLVIVLSVAIPALVGVLLLLPGKQSFFEGVNIYFFPKLNAAINSMVTVFLLAALWFIKRKDIPRHRIAMLGATLFSGLFLLSYVFYHLQAPQVRFGAEGAIRMIYLFILISHIVLAVVIVPLVLFSLIRGLNMDVARHRAIVKYSYPLWLYVSVTGVLVYLFMAPYYPG